MLLGQPGLKKYEQRDNVVFVEVELSTSPTVDVNIDYMSAVPSYEKPIPDPEQLEEKLAEFSSKQAPFTPIDTPKAVEDGDVAVIDFTGYLDDKEFEGGSAKKFNLRIGSNAFIPGFEEQLIGMEYGQERTITVTFPANYQSDELAGKEAKFVVKLHEIQEQKPFTPDDAFAQKVLSDESATLETLKEKLGDQVIAEELSQLYVTELKPKLVESLLDVFEFTLPNNIVEQEIDAKVREQLQYLSEEEQKVYMEDKQKFFELRHSVADDARDSIKTALIVEALADKEGIEAHEQEVISALTHQAMMTGQDAKELVKYYQENNLMASAKMALIEDKLFGRLLGFDK
jgi:trigger factor